MSKRNQYLLIILAVLLMGAGAWYDVYRGPAPPVHQAQQPGPPAGSGGSSAGPAPDYPIMPEKPYVLTILGSSGNLNEKQVNSMTRWREQVAEMARKRPEDIVLNGPASKCLVGLTFDDGPDGDITPQILDILNREGVKATFFVTGQQCRKFPLQVQRIHNGGHLVLSHTYSHRQLDLADRDTVNREIALTDQAIDEIIASPPPGCEASVWSNQSDGSRYAQGTGEAHHSLVH